MVALSNYSVQRKLQRQHYVFTLSVPLSILMAVPLQHFLTHRANRAGRDGRRPAHCPCGRVRSSEKNGIICRASKSIIQMLLRSIKLLRAAGLQLSTGVFLFLNTLSSASVNRQIHFRNFST